MSRKNPKDAVPVEDVARGRRAQGDAAELASLQAAQDLAGQAVRRRTAVPSLRCSVVRGHSRWQVVERVDDGHRPRRRHASQTARSGRPTSVGVDHVGPHAVEGLAGERAASGGRGPGRSGGSPRAIRPGCGSASRGSRCLVVPRWAASRISPRELRRGGARRATGAGPRGGIRCVASDVDLDAARGEFARQEPDRDLGAAATLRVEQAVDDQDARMRHTIAPARRLAHFSFSAFAGRSRIR